jgi:hypothetical protein
MAAFFIVQLPYRRRYTEQIEVADAATVIARWGP